MAQHVQHVGHERRQPATTRACLANMTRSACSLPRMYTLLLSSCVSSLGESAVR
jgi:hypothetical protein